MPPKLVKEAQGVVGEADQNTTADDKLDEGAQNTDTQDAAQGAGPDLAATPKESGPLERSASVFVLLTSFLLVSLVMSFGVRQVAHTREQQQALCHRSWTKARVLEHLRDANFAHVVDRFDKANIKGNLLMLLDEDDLATSLGVTMRTTRRPLAFEIGRLQNSTLGRACPVEAIGQEALQNLSIATRGQPLNQAELEQLLSHEVSAWKTDTVELWLATVGLGEHAAAFAAAHVSGRMLLMLDDDALREDLNVPDALERKRVLAEISTLPATGRGRSTAPSFTNTLLSSFGTIVILAASAGAGALKHLLKDVLNKLLGCIDLIIWAALFAFAFLHLLFSINPTAITVFFPESLDSIAHFLLGYYSFRPRAVGLNLLRQAFHVVAYHWGGVGVAKLVWWLHMDVLHKMPVVSEAFIVLSNHVLILTFTWLSKSNKLQFLVPCASVLLQALCLFVWLGSYPTTELHHTQDERKLKLHQKGDKASPDDIKTFLVVTQQELSNSHFWLLRYCNKAATKVVILLKRFTPLDTILARVQRMTSWIGGISKPKTA
eukprot:m.5931 g.5931  ORF g.5931 m.5931 type:complete len:547 (+) comp2499_c0_seq1:176-1816(+)